MAYRSQAMVRGCEHGKLVSLNRIRVVVTRSSDAHGSLLWIGVCNAFSDNVDLANAGINVPIDKPGTADRTESF